MQTASHIMCIALCLNKTLPYFAVLTEYRLRFVWVDESVLCNESVSIVKPQRARFGPAARLLAIALTGRAVKAAVADLLVCLLLGHRGGTRPTVFILPFSV